MPKIPMPGVRVSATVGRTNTSIDAPVSDEAAGAGVGRALQALGGDLGNAVDSYAAMRERKRAEEVANKVALADFTPTALAMRNDPKRAADGAGYYDDVGTAYDNFVTDQANAIEDDETRREFTNRMNAQRQNIMSNAAAWEATAAAASSKANADSALSTLQNRIMSSPGDWDMLVQQGKEVILSRPNVTTGLKQEMAKQWEQNAANFRFQGMLEQATTVEQIDAISQEFASDEWAARFAPTDYEQMANQMGTVRRAIVTVADTNAKAAIDTLDQRVQDGALIDPEEMRRVQQVVSQSQNPITLGKMARIVRDQGIIRDGLLSTPAELTAQNNAANGNPGAAYPGVPVRVSNAINTATGAFDVSASYLGATVTREYGQEFTTSPRGNPQFAPQSVNPNADLRNLQPGVVDAATVAGELFGAPLQLTSGVRTGTHNAAVGGADGSHHLDGSGIDVSTVGMSDTDKGRLVASLADAGFTGFGEYGTHIHADMRSTVPNTFGQNGTAWGGWTNLSPDVMEALTSRGFGAGVGADAIRRNGPPAAAEVDYGVQATTSSATGLFQFTEPTFLGLMKDGTTAARMGIDVTGMSDAQLLELRKDPEIATLAAAALGEQNKVTLEQTLGRPVSDPELYMAHFLGAQGAIVLLSAKGSNPTQPAAALLPDAAAANKNVFYTRGGRPLTVEEVYNDVARSFVASPSQVTYGDNVTRQNIADRMDAQLYGDNSDPMAWASQPGTPFNVGGLNSPADFTLRGQTARSVAEYYSIPVSDMKPFTESEATAIEARMDGATAEETMNVMSQIQAMGGDMARAAFKQIGEKDQVYGYAASLAYDAGQTSVATDIIRGKKRLDENPALKDGLGATQNDISAAFSSLVGNALFEAQGRDRQAIQDAAFAHYIETYTARGGVGWDANAFGNSVQAVLGGTQNAPAIATVNGEQTVLPAGISGEMLETAFRRMTVDDWTLMSPSKLPPRDANNDIIPPEALAVEAGLRAIGGGQYKVFLDDGAFAVTGRVSAGGQVEAYVFAPDKAMLSSIVSRPTSGGPTISGREVVPSSQPGPNIGMRPRL